MTGSEKIRALGKVPVVCVYRLAPRIMNAYCETDVGSGLGFVFGVTYSELVLGTLQTKLFYTRVRWVYAATTGGSV